MGRTRNGDGMKYRIRAAILAILINTLFLWAMNASIRQPAIGCSTDTECAELCPAEDIECDGGPESWIN